MTCCCTWLSSSRQGGHHVAQKLSSTTLPRSSLRATLLPSIISTVKSGASAPSPGQRRGGGFGRFVGGLFRCCCGFTLPFHLVGVPQCDADHCDQGQQDDEHPVVRFLTCHISEMLYS